MFRQRLRGEGESVRLPAPPQAVIAPHAFVLCPFGCAPGVNPVQWLCQQAVYRWAFEEAQAVARPSILERDLLAAWN
jgi:hypothetical protein